jgi:hypothetical protein
MAWLSALKDIAFLMVANTAAAVTFHPPTLKSLHQLLMKLDRNFLA